MTSKNKFIRVLIGSIIIIGSQYALKSIYADGDKIKNTITSEAVTAKPIVLPDPLYYPADCYINISEFANCENVKVVVSHPCTWTKYDLKNSSDVLAQFTNNSEKNATVGMTIGINSYSDKATEEFMKLKVSEAVIKNKLQRLKVNQSSYVYTKISGLSGSEFVGFSPLKNVGYCYMLTNSMIYKNHIITITYIAAAADKNLALNLFNRYKKEFRSNIAKTHTI